MIINRTYMGQHVFGKRSQSRNGKVIIQQVPALVSEPAWKLAQQVLGSNQTMRGWPFVS
jgi:Recombinase